MLARLAAAAFAVSMICASACSAMCATGFCAADFQHSSSDGCDRHPGHSPAPAQNPAPQNHECSPHGHPKAMLLKSGGQDTPALAHAAHAAGFAVSAQGPRQPAALPASPRDRAPAASPPGPHFPQTSVLRI